MQGAQEEQNVEQTAADVQPVENTKVYKTKQEIVERIKEIAHGEENPDKDEVDYLKTVFYKMHIAEREAAYKAFVESGADPTTFQILPDEDEEVFKAEMGIVKERRAKIFREQEEEKEANLKRKLEIIEKIKTMVGSPEEANKSYQEFKTLQQEWKEIRNIPAAKVSELWRMDENEHSVYLTFDDGPIPESTPFILKTLREFDIKATFFVVGDNVRKYPELYKQIVDEGHGIGNHTFNHLGSARHSIRTYEKNVAKCDELIHSDLFRPPHGWMRPTQNPLQTEISRSFGRCIRSLLRYYRARIYLNLSDRSAPSLTGRSPARSCTRTSCATPFTTSSRRLPCISWWCPRSISAAPPRSTRATRLWWPTASPSSPSCAVSWAQRATASSTTAAIRPARLSSTCISMCCPAVT